MRNRQHGARRDGDAGKREAAEASAIAALSFLAAEPERLGRFLAMTGIGPDEIRAAASEPHFLAGVIEHIVGDEALLVAFATHAQVKPQEVERALAALGGAVWERDVP
jgi:Protein of unknown function (DUF3572)